MNFLPLPSLKYITMNILRKLLIVIFSGINLNLFSLTIPVGKGSYTDVLPLGESAPQSTMYKTEKVTSPIPANDWWSSVVSDKWSFPHFAFPFSFDFDPHSQYGVIFTINYPNELTYTSSDIFGSHSNSGLMKVRVKKINGDYIHPEDVRLDSFGDFHISVFVKDNNSNEYYKTTYGHGLCFVYFEFSNGIDSVEIEFSADIQGFNRNTQNESRINQYPYTEIFVDNIGIEVIKNPRTYYGFYFSEDTRVLRISQSPPVLSIRFTGSDKFLSIGILTSRQDLDFFYNYAYSFVSDTKVEWSYNETNNEVITNFQVHTTSKRFNQQNTLLALFPHQWKNLNSGNMLYGKEYTTLRGKMKVSEGNSFSVKNRFFGILPFLPNMVNTSQRQHIYQLLNSEKDTLLEGPSEDDDNTYSTAKRVAKVAEMISVADQVGDVSTRDYLITRLKNVLTNWFTYTEGEKELFFYYDKNWGGLIGYNPAFDSENFTDQHFHYGYIIYASAILGLYDKSFVNDYGGIVEMLIRNCASPYRNDPLFPFLRTMDPYEGHSWANGFARGYDGNDQESTSEAMNFWTSVILWGLVTGNTTYRDLGIWGYTTEYSAIREYWFDIDKDIYPLFQRCLVSIVFGGKATHATYFSAQPECIHGIQFIPVHGGSFYLAYDIDYARKNYDEIVFENNNQPEDEVGWHSIIWRFQSLFDAPSVLQKYHEDPLCLNDGDSWTSLYYWLNNMNYLGRVASNKVYSDYSVYGVFDGYDGVRKYVVYNFDSSSRVVNFYDVSDGNYLGSLVVGGYSMLVSSSLVDIVEPDILDISLIEGSSVYGKVEIQVEVRDNVGIDRVEFYIDGNLVSIDNEYPYEYVWDSSGYSVGEHIVKVVVYDVNGLSSYRDVRVNVVRVYKLSISVVGMGYVEVDPYKEEYLFNESVKLVAVSSSGYIFSHWSGDVVSTSNPINIVMNGDKNIVCNFREIVSNVSYYMLNIVIEPLDGGEVKMEPSGGVYEVNSVVTLYAEAKEGYRFLYWYGDIIGVNNPINIVMDRDKVVVCKFEKLSDEDNRVYSYKIRSYPNPFVIGKEVCEIRFMVEEVVGVKDIEVKLYDNAGRLIRKLEVVNKGENRYISIWDGKDNDNKYVKSGIYFCNVKYKNKNKFAKIVGVK